MVCFIKDVKDHTGAMPGTQKKKNKKLFGKKTSETEALEVLRIDKGHTVHGMKRFKGFCSRPPISPYAPQYFRVGTTLYLDFYFKRKKK